MNQKNAPIPNGYKQLAGSERHKATGANRIADADPTEKINITICIRRRPDGEPLPDHEHWMQTPPGRRKFVSHEEFAEKHGALQNDLDAVASFVQSHGLSVVESHQSRRMVIVSDTVAQVSEAFGVKLGTYEYPHGKYRGREGFLHIPLNLDGIITGVFGLDNRRIAKRNNNLIKATNGLSVPQIQNYYQFPTNSAAGQTIGIFEVSDPTPGDGLCGYMQSDIDAYFGTSLGIGPNFPAPVMQDVSINGATNSPGVTDADGEVLLDIEIAGAAAAGANIAVYFTTWDENGWVLALSAMVHPMAGQPSPTAVSISWGWAELEAYVGLSWSSMVLNEVSAIFQEGAALGMTFFVASGDGGDTDGITDNLGHVDYPASDPWVTGCGGTVIATNTGDYVPGGPFIDTSATYSGGGISDFFELPPWQVNANIPPSENPGGRIGRGVPDIAGMAYVKTVEEDAPTYENGTSCVAPLYAGLITTINNALNTKVGFINPVLYDIAQSPGGDQIIRDINDGGNNYYTIAGYTSPGGYTCGPGWDGLTGLGVINGLPLLGYLKQLSEPSLTFVQDRTTFSQGEVMATGGIFNQALFIIVDGFRPTDFPGGGVTALSSSATPPTQAQLNSWAPVIPGPIAASGPTNITLTPTAVESDDPSLSPEVQRFTFTYQLTFPDQSAFTTPPASDFPQVLPLVATLNGLSETLSARATIELTLAADPYFSNEANGGLYWLSEDLRVFYAVEGSTMFGAPPLGSTPAAAQSFIQYIIANMSGPLGNCPGSTDTFETTLSPNQASSAIGLSPTTFNAPYKRVYNFAIARVRMDGTPSTQQAKNVRAFFRLFQSQSLATAYQAPGVASGVSGPVGAYRQWSDGVTYGKKAPLLGISADGKEYITVPCFASARVANTTTANNMTTQQDPPNVKTITPAPEGTTYTYFGCWIDNNQSELIFPYTPGTNPDGPFTGQKLYSLAQVIDRGGHQCLVVEIVDDDAPIVNYATPATSDKIAQRNLAFTPVANPGRFYSRISVHTFELRPSVSIFNRPVVTPDELMIEWGNIPAGSTAAIYLPAVQASKIIQLADSLYATHNLRAADANTIECPAGGTTYIPIPVAALAENYAGLLSIMLPADIKNGQQFNVVIRQLTDAFNPDQRAGEKRYIYGAIEISIPVSIKTQMLLPEEHLLSVMKWITESIPKASRWYPVMERYVEMLIYRVDDLGGNGATVPATQNGLPPGRRGI